jgi:hypothetical protein
VIEYIKSMTGLEDSLSGSASSSEEDEDSDDAVSTLLSRHKPKDHRASRSPSPDASRSAPQSALTWFHAPPSTQIGIYRAILPLGASDYLAELRRVQTGHGDGRKWAVFMTAGGHFAGAIVRVSRSDEDLDAEREESEKPATEPDGTETGARRRKKPKPKAKRPEVEILLHKTFHRYTSQWGRFASQRT